MRSRPPFFLLCVLVLLSVCYLTVSLSPWPVAPKHEPVFSSDEAFYEFVEGQPIQLPDGGAFVVHRAQVELLRMEPASDGDQVAFDLCGDGERYSVDGFVSLHNSDGVVSPIVNLGKGWFVSKLTK
ncbi:hypothetical protein [Paludisphaera rhizosphaerae]|uniref:hypothetical protein n=1 Tax=Paludisphaera rhizosphaerae TaxID=2711216 RepID=UPI0013EB9C3E|nr:hypothetical protein [Paludisphaera rhizosphaerae]